MDFCDVKSSVSRYTSDTSPCNFAQFNSVSTEEWTSCAERLGLTPDLLAAQSVEIQTALDHIFDIGYGPYATGVSTSGTTLQKVPVTGELY